MVMHVKILGSGTILSNSRNSSGYLINIQNNLALMDCGPGILNKLVSLNIDPLSLSSLFLSHFHIDHYSDVLPVLMRRYLKNQQINRNFTIFGPVGLKYWFEIQSRLHGDWFSDNKPRLIEMHISEQKWAGWTVKSYPTRHTQNSIAFKFLKDGKSFFYSSDTDYDDALVNFAEKAQWAILECSHSDQNPVKGHLTPSTVAKFINNAALKNTVITHIYPENDTADLLERIQVFSDRDIQIGYDFMELEI